MMAMTDDGAAKCAAEAYPVALVDSLLQDQDQRIDILAKQVSVLLERLRPVTRPEVEGSDASEPRDVPVCGEVARRITEATDRIRRITDRVVGATDLLEV